MKLIDIIPGNPIKKGNMVLINPCPICRHKDHFFIYPNNTYFSFSGCCRGGTIIDWMMEYQNLNKYEAILAVENLEGKNIKDLKINAKNALKINSMDIQKLDAKIYRLKKLKGDLFDVWNKYKNDIDFNNYPYFVRYMNFINRKFDELNCLSDQEQEDMLKNFNFEEM